LITSFRQPVKISSQTADYASFLLHIASQIFVATASSLSSPSYYHAGFTPDDDTASEASHSRFRLLSVITPLAIYFG